MQKWLLNIISLSECLLVSNCVFTFSLSSSTFSENDMDVSDDSDGSPLVTFFSVKNRFFITN